MLKIEDGRGMILEIDNPTNVDHEVLTLKYKNREVEADFIIDLKARIQLAQYFEENGVFLPKVAEWLESEQKEVVTKEDLASMLETVQAMSINLLKQRDATVEAINRLNGIYQRYTNKENHNG